MKKFIGTLFLLSVTMLTPGWAQQNDPQPSKISKKEAKEAEGKLLFQTALHALKTKNFVIEKYDPLSTNKALCYDWIKVQGDTIYTQGIWGPGQDKNSGGGFSQSHGTIKKMELEEDDKGNILITFEAQLITDQGYRQNQTWYWKRRVKLFKNSNVIPWPGGYRALVVTPTQSNLIELHGAMPVAVP